ncbi:MAG: hypothetical protein HZC48_11485 [Nitrospirae bacterium]|nr:hypothetical protein [Nitrospirota bacterium]
MSQRLFFRGRNSNILTKCLLIVLCISMALPFPAMAESGGTITTPIVPPGFLFEPESTIDSLKTVSEWNEVEQLMDNPYAVIRDTSGTPGNAQGYPSYITTIVRRKSFLPPGCTYNPAVAGPDGGGLPLCNNALLPQFPIHPLNYNPTTGEEMRLLSPLYTGGNFRVPLELVDTGELNADGLPIYQWTYQIATISPGADRVFETSIDYNSPIRPDVNPLNPDTFACIIGTEANPPEGSTICGGDPGEPGYLGFGALGNTNVQRIGLYSVPAVPLAGLGVPGGSLPGGLRVPGTVIPTNKRLFDPERGYIQARNATTGAGGLRKPSLRIPDAGGTPANPNYLANTDPNDVLPSNENDYIRGATFAEKQAARDAATIFGKAVFWDMQVGSDGVQSCGSCHFSALVDDRVKNQLNPNHLGGDLTLQLHGPNANQQVTAADFPLHKLADITSPGEPLLNSGNVIFDTNDVMSSMGVVFRQFVDVPVGTTAFFTAPGTGIKSLLPDIGNAVPDPIPAFQGLRRVEPRNTPSLFSAAMNFDNFWDGRARHDFNGGSVFGASDPGNHVFVNNGATSGSLSATRQIIRFSSLASLATGPALSEFEMSFAGRNWAKIGKKLLQSGVTPLANQLVDKTDSVLGIYSNQGGSACAGLPVADRSGNGLTAAGKPGLCISYPALIRRAFYPHLWSNTTQHLNGAPSGDPFDFYSLTITAGAVSPSNTNQFTQMEANMSLFFGLGVQIWGQILIPDNTPFDRFLDVNPDAFLALGEAGEPLLVNDQRSCSRTEGRRPCFTELGNFKRDPNLIARLNPANEGGIGATEFPDGGTRQPGQPDPLLGSDLFNGTNLSLKNPNFRSTRCGACHLGANLTDNNFERTHAVSLGDFASEFLIPGIENILEPLGRGRLISGFLLESELNENGQDAIERFIANQSLTVDPETGLAFPDGAFFLDNGVYNIGVRPIDEDISRGGDDPFGWPLSLSALMLKNLGGPAFEPGVPLTNFDPDLGVGGGLFEETAQDQMINPGLEADPLDPQLPPHLAPWVNNDNVGNSHPEMDELFGGLNTLTESPMLEGYVDTLGPFNPAGVVNEALNNAEGPLMGMWPVVNRVGRMGNFKAPQLRNVEFTGPYFHNGGQLTLRQVVDFYARGGDFPITNAAHRDMMILNLREEIQSLGRLNDPSQLYPDGFTQEEALVALVDYLLELTDSRVKYEQAPYDHPEVFVPLDGTAPDNTFGRPGFLANLSNGLFRQVTASGAGGHKDTNGNLIPTPSFLGVTTVRNNPNCNPSSGPISHYCH